MPYIFKGARRLLEKKSGATNAGELNFEVTTLVSHYIKKQPLRATYASINEAIGVLECAKLELYRRVAVPYEDRKIEQNGDVYPKELIGK